MQTQEILTKSKKKSIYENLEFREHPYDQNEKFAVFIPKQEDKIMQLIEKERMKSSQNFRPANSFFAQSSQNIQNEEQRSGTQSKQSYREKLIKEVQSSRDHVPSQAVPKQTNWQSLEEQNQAQNTLGNENTQDTNAREKNTQSQKSWRIHSKPKLNAGDSSNHRYLGSSSLFSKSCTSSQSKRSSELLRQKLYFDDNTRTAPKTTLKNQVIENIVQESEVFLRNKQLLESVYKLKQLNLLKQHQVHVNKFPGIGKFDFVLNDFHNKSTNPGFSRNKEGGYFYNH